jgi:nucleoid DNA-binding protein
MKKPALARRLARQSHVSQAIAADELDRVVHRILKNLRKGQPTELPGLGTFTPGPQVSFRFDSPKPSSGKA